MKNPSISQVNPRSPATCRPLRVLLVEDSELDAGLVIRELERADYQPSWQRVATAPDMAAALKQERWDLVISDYMMPGFGGLEALALAQGTGLDLPFILISGTIGEDLAVEAMRAGAHDYLLKDRLTRLGPAIARELKDVQSRRERRQVEDQLRLESAALNAAANGIVITDRDGTILAVNPAWTAMTGYAAEEALGRNPRILKSGVQDAAFYRNLWETILGGRVWRGELVNQRKDGSRYFEEETITPVRDADGEITHFVGIKQDISERKGLENQFLRAQRLEAVGKLAAGVAHDLNNILAPIMMAAPLLRDSPTAGDFNQSLDLIESSALRGAGVVRQLLTFSRGREGERIVMHLKHLVRDLELIIRETFPRSIRFEPSLAPDLWPLFVDPTQLHQVLLNLCINARDAMPEGGVLRLTASNLMVDEQYAGLLPGLESGPYLQLEVSDNGQGIAPEDQERIFDLFFSTKEPGAGSGLGLATVQRVVTDHGGVVKVRSQLGQGTSFQLYLPARPAEVAIVEAQLLTLGPVGQGELILVVDDEDSIIQITQEMLRRHGYRTLTAADGTEAVACLAQHPIEIKAVITDLLMPEMDGFRLVQVLKHMAPDLPVLVSSGLEENREHEARFERLREFGVTCFLTKPYSAIQCLTALRAALTVPGRPEAQTTPKR